jgi:hypothetical protein
MRCRTFIVISSSIYVHCNCIRTELNRTVDVMQAVVGSF